MSLEIAARLVKQTFPVIPTMASITAQDLDAAPAELPDDLLDVVGFHMFAVEQDPNVDPVYQHYLARLQETFPGRDWVVISDSWWLEDLHAPAGLAVEILVERAGQYRRVAEDLGALALGAFIWQSFPGGTGLRDLPDVLIREYQRIGAELGDRCGVPAALPSLDGESALFFHDCRFYATVRWRNPANGEEGRAVARNLTRDSGVFWFFDDSNVEVTLKLLDGRALNDHWWVFWSHMTDLELRLEIVDTITGETILYTDSAVDTSAFREIPEG